MEVRRCFLLCLSCIDFNWVRSLYSKYNNRKTNNDYICFDRYSNGSCDVSKHGRTYEQIFFGDSSKSKRMVGMCKSWCKWDRFNHSVRNNVFYVNFEWCNIISLYGELVLIWLFLLLIYHPIHYRIRWFCCVARRKFINGRFHISYYLVYWYLPNNAI